jgi:uncharacterized protein (UPF0335 family)
MTKPATQNEPQEADVRQAFSELVAFEDELSSERGSYMQRCRTIRGSIGEVYDSAKSKGITKKVLKSTFKEYLLRQKADACRADLEADEQHERDMLAEKLGDLAGLPLGQAAMAADAGKGKKKRGETTLESLAQA